MTVFLTLEEALTVAAAVIAGPVEVRDYGLLESALARPQTTIYGDEVYPDLDQKAAALLQSVVGNHALVDGDKRLGFACLSVFLNVNGSPLALTEEQAYELTIDVAAEKLKDLGEIGRRLRSDG